MPSRSKYLIFMDSRPTWQVVDILISAGFECEYLISDKDRAVAAYSDGTYGFVFAGNPDEVKDSIPMSGHCRASEFTEEIARSLPGTRTAKKEPPPMETPTKFEPGQRWRFRATQPGSRHAEPVAKITAEIAASKTALSAFVAAVNALPAKAAE